MYKCAKCGREVKVDSKGNKTRTCVQINGKTPEECATAAIIAECSARVVGRSKVR